MGIEIKSNGSNIARKNKIVLKVGDTELGIITSFSSSESRSVESYFTYGGDVENAKCLIPQLTKDKTISVTSLILFKPGIMNIIKDSADTTDVDTLTKQLTPFTIEEYNTDVETGNSMVTVYQDCLFQNLNLDQDLNSGSLALTGSATIVYRKKNTEYLN